MLTALFCAYEKYWALLYFDTGYVFDTLVFFFGMATVLAYLAVRQKGRDPRGWETAGIACLYICALNSKELAASIPLILLAYEFLFMPPADWRRPRWRQFAGVGWLVLITLAFLVGRTRALASNPAYAPEFTWQRFAASNGELFNALFLRPAWATGADVLAVWGSALAIALIFRSRVLIFAWWFAFAAMLPLAFVVPRWGPQFYWPLFGCALYAGFAIAGTAGWLWNAVAPKAPLWAGPCAAAALFLGVMLPLYSQYKPLGMSQAPTVTDEAPVMMSVAAQMHELYPSLPHGSRILFLNDPIRVDWYNMIFIMQLSYREPSLVIKRVKEMNPPPDMAATAGFDYVVGYRDGRFYDARAAGEVPAKWASTPGDRRR
jgi:hypothetical protein